MEAYAPGHYLEQLQQSSGACHVCNLSGRRHLASSRAAGKRPAELVDEGCIAAAARAIRSGEHAPASTLQIPTVFAAMRHAATLPSTKGESSRVAGRQQGTSRSCQELKRKHATLITLRRGERALVVSEPLRVARLFDLSLVWQGFRGFREKCRGIPQKAAAARFAGR